MATTHVCHVDCKLIHEGTRTIHMMYAAEPSSAAGRYQWEQNAKIKRQGRRAWRATGQGQSRACREWDRARHNELQAQLDLGFEGKFVDRPLSRARGRRIMAVLAEFA